MDDHSANMLGFAMVLGYGFVLGFIIAWAVT